jgi:methionyl aminopeptidase
MFETIERDSAIIGRAGGIKLHGPEGFEGMRRAGRVAAEILDALVPHVVAGVTTQALDDIVYAEMRARGATPATLGYRGYTKSCCTSINHVVCHGIPGDRILKDGDIVNIDVTPIVDGWHGDTSRMYLVGDVPLKARRLVDVTYECLMLGIEQARPGNHPATSATPFSATPSSTATASSAISAATASAATFTIRPRSSMSAAPAPAPSSGPACSSRSNR